MANILPTALIQVIDELGKLPGVGVRTAERYAYSLLRTNPQNITKIAEALNKLHSGVKYCPITFALINADEEMSELYTNPDRDKTVVAVVEEPLDIVALEKTGKFAGTYHVLGGAISPIDGVGPEQLHIPELISRIKKDDVQELIIATNASVEGESTSLFIQKYIKDAQLSIKMSRLARGIPVGVDLEYTDQITLAHALEDRSEIGVL